jgi:hypothetical protein
MSKGRGRYVHPMSDRPGYHQFYDPDLEHGYWQRLTLWLAWQMLTRKALRRKESRQKLLQTNLRGSLG